MDNKKKTRKFQDNQLEDVIGGFNDADTDFEELDFEKHLTEEPKISVSVISCPVKIEREHYEKPSIRRRKKPIAARKKKY